AVDLVVGEVVPQDALVGGVDDRRHRETASHLEVAGGPVGDLTEVLVEVLGELFGGAHHSPLARTVAVGMPAHSRRRMVPSAGTVSPWGVVTPSLKTTDITQGMPNSRETIPRWHSLVPSRVMRPLTPAVRAGATNVVEPLREITIVSSTSGPMTKSITSSGVSSQMHGPSTGSCSTTFCPSPTWR